jgi:hypothetical protein
VIIRRFIIGVFAFSTLAVAPSSVFAQSAPKGDVAVSYSILHDSDLEETFPVGWVLSASRHFNSKVSLVGEVGGNYKTVDFGIDEVKLKVHSFLGGVRLANRGAAKAVPFAQVLAGLARANGSFLGESESSNGFAIQPGAGVDVTVSENVGIRFQGDYRLVRSEGETGNEFRFAVGAVFGFGK